MSQPHDPDTPGDKSSADNQSHQGGHPGEQQFGQGQPGQYGQGQDPRYAQPGQPGQPQPGHTNYGQPQYGQPQYGQSQPPQYGQPQYGQPQYGQGQPPQYGQPQYGQSQYGQGQPPQYGQGQYGQPQYGQSAQQGQHPQYGQPVSQGEAATQPGQFGQPGQPGDQFSTMTVKSGSSKRTRTAIFGGIGAVVLIAAIILITAFAWPGWAPKSLDQNAVQDGVKQVLTKDYQATNVTDVSCPSGQSVEKGHSFTCTAMVGGQKQQVKVTILDDDGKYEVSRPTS